VRAPSAYLIPACKAHEILCICAEHRIFWYRGQDIEAPADITCLPSCKSSASLTLVARADKSQGTRLTVEELYPDRKVASVQYSNAQSDRIIKAPRRLK